MKRHIPNFITLMNLFSGCLSICFTLLWEDYTSASWAIVIAALFDLFDGLVARLLGAQSKIGGDLDSLSDVVSFGVAPSMMLFHYIHGTMALETPFLWAAPAFLIALFSAYRLAKFNNDTRQTTGFFGIPVPANALFWIGGVASLSYLSPYLHPYILLGVIYCFVLLSSWGLISDLPLLSFKVHFPLSSLRDKLLLLFGMILLVLGIAFVSLWGWAGVSIVVLLYVLISFFVNINSKY